MLFVSNLKCLINGRIIFKDVSFNLFKSDVLHVIGSNGSGKTTLLKLLSFLYRNKHGNIFFNGKCVRNNSNYYLGNIIFIGHKHSIHLLLTPIENLVFYMSLSCTELLMNIKKALIFMGIDNKMDSRCLELSVGQCQRVLLSRLLIQKSRIWILDEPYSYLDSDGMNLLNKIILSFLKSGGIVIISDHSNTIQNLYQCKILNLENFR
ncbi:MAG TPA: heme ABC exporter ATP-binding protein CcmA [Candidatus Azoamicus sp. OHIO1]